MARIVYLLLTITGIGLIGCSSNATKQDIDYGAIVEQAINDASADVNADNSAKSFREMLNEQLSITLSDSNASFKIIVDGQDKVYEKGTRSIEAPQLQTMFMSDSFYYYFMKYEFGRIFVRTTKSTLVTFYAVTKTAKIINSSPWTEFTYSVPRIRAAFLLNGQVNYSTQYRWRGTTWVLNTQKVLTNGSVSVAQSSVQLPANLPDTYFPTFDRAEFDITYTDFNSIDRIFGITF